LLQEAVPELVLALEAAEEELYFDLHCLLLRAVQ
jgi:hypothetical protein